MDGWSECGSGYGRMVRGWLGIWMDGRSVAGDILVDGWSAWWLKRSINHQRDSLEDGRMDGQMDALGYEWMDG